MAGNTTAHGQNEPVSGQGGNPIANETSSALTDGKTVPAEGGLTRPVEKGTSQISAPLNAFAESYATGQEQSQPAAANAASMGSEKMDSLQAHGNTGALVANLSATSAPVAGKSAVVSGNRGSKAEILRAARAGGKSGLTQQGIQVHGRPASAAGMDAAAMVRDPSARGALSATDDGAREINSAASGLTETFAALDAEGTSGKPTWIHAGTQRAEAGIEDPELGWVGVRADMGGGGVHASLVPGSADAAQALGGHLAGLNSYLSDHHTPVETLTLAAPETGWSGSGAGAGLGQGNPAGQNAGGGSETGASSRSSPQDFEEMNADTSTDLSGGTYISVLA